MDSINVVFMYGVPTVTFDNEDVQAKAEKLIQLVTRLKSTDDVNIHEELNQEFHQAITELVQEQARSASSNSVAENIKYNHFIQEINVVRENGIWLK